MARMAFGGVNRLRGALGGWVGFGKDWLWQEVSISGRAVQLQLQCWAAHHPAHTHPMSSSGAPMTTPDPAAPPAGAAPPDVLAALPSLTRFRLERVLACDAEHKTAAVLGR